MKEADKSSEAPVELVCERCAACCRWPGEVRLGDEEIARLAEFRQLPEAEFIARFTRLRKDRRGLALIEQPDHSCIFLEGNRCVVQAVKPEQCKEFPNRWMKALWGRVTLEEIGRDYPMLVNCQAFQTFYQRQGK